MKRTIPQAVLTAAFALMLALPATAQLEFSMLGLSAEPDAYVAEKTVAFGEEFDLYVILTGPEGESPLPWILDSVNWAVLQNCCGGSPAYLIDSELLGPDLVHTGEPVVGVTSAAADCVQQDVVALARLTFTWVETPTRNFYLGAAATTAAVTCDEDFQLLSSRSVEITPTGVTPAEESSWGAVKRLYR